DEAGQQDPGEDGQRVGAQWQRAQVPDPLPGAGDPGRGEQRFHQRSVPAAGAAERSAARTPAASSAVNALRSANAAARSPSVRTRVRTNAEPTITPSA